MGDEPDDVHSNYRERSALRRKPCRELASFDLPKEIDWSMFEGLDFEAMASRPRDVVGRPNGMAATFQQRSPDQRSAGACVLFYSAEHAGPADIVTAYNCLLSEFHPYAHASKIARGGGDWLAEAATYMPFGPSLNEYVAMMYRMT